MLQHPLEVSSFCLSRAIEKGGRAGAMPSSSISPENTGRPLRVVVADDHVLLRARAW